MNKALFFLLTGLTLGLSSCLKNNIEEDKKAENEQEIQKYIADKKLTVTKTTSGLYYAITQPSGSSRVPVLGDAVTFHYVLRRLMDDVIIDSSRVSKNKPFKLTFGINRGTLGLNEGLGLLHEGDMGLLLVPSYLAYGAGGGAALLPYSTIRYDLNVLKIRNEDEQINDYVAENKLRVDERTESGLRFTYLQKGLATADTVKATYTVNATFTGKLLDGTVFQPEATSSYNLTNTTGTIKGFREALLKMRVGDKVRVIFPSPLGYGTTGSSSILPYSPLIFEILVNSVTK